jgi:hypothetical protein
LPFPLDLYLFGMDLVVGIIDRRALGLGTIFFMFCVRRFWFHKSGSDPARPPVVRTIQRWSAWGLLNDQICDAFRQYV